MPKQRFLSLVSSQAQSGTSSNFTTSYEPAFNFSSGVYSVSLVSASIPYTIYNISAALGNNTLHYFNGTNNVTTTLGDGCYSVSAINTTVQSLIGNTNIAINVDTTRLRVTITLTNDYTIDFTKGDSFNNLIGFNPQILTSQNVALYADNSADITNGNDSFYICCDLVDPQYSNIGPLRSGALYGFNFLVGQGSDQTIVPFERVHLPIGPTYCNSINLKIVNQNGEVVDLNNEIVSVNILITKEE